MSDQDYRMEEQIRHFAIILARQCIEDWAHENWFENNDIWGTDFTDDQMFEIVSNAQQVLVTLPEVTR